MESFAILGLYFSLLRFIYISLQPACFRRRITDEGDYVEQISQYVEDLGQYLAHARPTIVDIGPRVLSAIGTERHLDLIRRVNALGREHGFEAQLARHDGDPVWRVEYREAA